MKLIVAGANGFIGLETLRLALAHPDVTSLIALTRKPLPSPYTDEENPKLRTIIIEDFTSYPSSVLSQLAGAEGCIWTIGAKSTNIDVMKKVSLEYSTTAARTFSALPPPGKHFKFIFLSGFVTVRDQNSSTWLFEEPRKFGGLIESELLALSEQNESLKMYIMRPGFVLGKEQRLVNFLGGASGLSVQVDELAGVLVEVAVKGGERITWSNGDLRKRGRELASIEKL